MSKSAAAAHDAANATLASAIEAARAHYTAANPKSLALHREAEAALPGGN
ncbi:MAG: hypothetical protein JSS20_17605, partial [Proteobacteria bacterium]|nr:hypothetical protein [Pseudomonadota bacterium]